MCKMVFSIEGKTENYVKLQKDGNGIEFLGECEWTSRRILRHVCFTH